MATTMKHLFDPGVASDVKQRILRLGPQSERLWGTMTAAQTLAHCTSGLQMAMGTIKPKRAPFPRQPTRRADSAHGFPR